MRELLKHWPRQEGSFCSTKGTQCILLTTIAIMVFCANLLAWLLGGRQENLSIFTVVAVILISFPALSLFWFVRRAREYRKAFGFLPPTTFPGMVGKNAKIQSRMQKGLITSLKVLYQQKEAVTQDLRRGELPECKGASVVSGFDDMEHRLHTINEQIRHHEEEFHRRIGLANDPRFPYPMGLSDKLEEWLVPSQVPVGD